MLGKVVENIKSDLFACTNFRLVPIRLVGIYFFVKLDVIRSIMVERKFPMNKSVVDLYTSYFIMMLLKKCT